MADVLALIPARTGSKGIVHKNFTPLAGGLSPFQRATQVADAAGIRRIVVTSDMSSDEGAADCARWSWWVHRPPELASDEASMIDVVKHALAAVEGPADEIILLLQPTQPLRTPAHLQAAIALLEESGADSVVSVVELPLTHSPELVFRLNPAGRRHPWLQPFLSGVVSEHCCDDSYSWGHRPKRRQDATPAYMADGTVYGFRRATVLEYGNIYGFNNPYSQGVRPLIIPAEETCQLDTPADWAEAERRLQARA